MVLLLARLLLPGRPAPGEDQAASAIRPAIDLSGAWDFRADPGDVGKAERWWEPGVAFEREIAVPGAWNAQGVGTPAKPPGEDAAVWRLEGSGNPSQAIWHAFDGPGWYRRTVAIPADWQGKVVWLKFGGVHRYADVWVNGEHVGRHVGYVTPFQFDISRHAKPGQRSTITVRVDARQGKRSDALLGCFDTLDFLYITWGGIYRKVTLEATPPAWIDDVFVAPRLSDETAEVQVTIGQSAGKTGNRAVEIAAEIVGQDGGAVARGKAAMSESNRVRIPLRIANPRLWSPRDPHLYTARVTLLEGGRESDRVSTRFGMREFGARGGRFLLNGKPFFARGYGDDCIYPNTIVPPADRAECRRRLELAKEYGFNYVRHHSWCPLEEYFEVADELGMLLQPEFAIAYRWELAKTPEAKQLYLEQWEGMIRAHRNHPSIGVWCMGNELYDGFDMAPAMYRLAKQLDPTRLVIDSDGCNLGHESRQTLDFLVVQFGESGSFGYQDGKYGLGGKMPGKPVVAHEMGYFVTLPDLTQIELFRGGLRPYWLFQARQTARAKGVEDVYPQWVDWSNRLQALCLKTNYEAARRSPGMSGYHQWLFQDYPNCAEGVVDMFFRPKALAAGAFRKFNAPTVLLMDCPRRSFHSGETAKTRLLVSRYEQEPSDRATLSWKLRLGSEVLDSGSKQGLRVGSEGLQELMALDLHMPDRPGAGKLTLAVELADENGIAANDWSFWVFPKARLRDESRKVLFRGIEGFEKLYPWARKSTARPRVPDCDLLVESRCDAGVMAYLEEGGRALVLGPEPFFSTVAVSGFRPSGWDPKQRGGHVGTVVRRDHPAVRNMPCEGWCDLQFHALLQGSKAVNLEELPARIDPIVRSIDVPQRLMHKALLFEARVGKGRLLVSGLNFAGALGANDPAAAYFLDQLVRYGLGPEFAPAARLR